jgi:hypothetical protein
MIDAAQNSMQVAWVATLAICCRWCGLVPMGSHVDVWVGETPLVAVSTGVPFSSVCSTPCPQVLLPQLHCLVADIASSSSAGKHTGHGSSGAVGLSGAATSGAVPGQGVSGVKSSGRESGGPLKGREVLAVLSEAARGGQPAWSSCAQRLLWHVHQVLLRQISSWWVAIVIWAGSMQSHDGVQGPADAGCMIKCYMRNLYASMLFVFADNNMLPGRSFMGDIHVHATLWRSCHM